MHANVIALLFCSGCFGMLRRPSFVRDFNAHLLNLPGLEGFLSCGARGSDIAGWKRSMISCNVAVPRNPMTSKQFLL